MAIVARAEVAPGKYETDPEGFARFIAMRAVVMIHDWTVTDDSGKRVPISIEGLDSLDSEDGDFISIEAAKRYNGDATPLATSSEPTSATESTSPTPEQSESAA